MFEELYAELRAKDDSYSANGPEDRDDDGTESYSSLVTPISQYHEHDKES